jgi:hypothetical protein
MKRLITALLVAIIFCWVSSNATAEAIYSTFGPGDSFSISDYSTVLNDPSFASDPILGLYSYLTVAAPIVPSYDANLDSIDVALSLQLAGSSVVDPEITFRLTTDTGGLPGDIIESFVFTVTSSTPEIFSMESTDNPFLSSSSSYWLVALSSIQYTKFGWHNSDTVTTPFLRSVGGWYDSDLGDFTPAYRLNGAAPVPEPSTFLLLGGGLAGLAFVVRRKRKD